MTDIQPLVVMVGFLLFRVFDIWKPFGIRMIDRKHTPASVILDDVAAGAVALLCEFLIARYLVSKLNG
jgi:phosphatidylglycerophosphatase A